MFLGYVNRLANAKPLDTLKMNPPFYNLLTFYEIIWEISDFLGKSPYIKNVKIKNQKTKTRPNCFLKNPPAKYLRDSVPACPNPVRFELFLVSIFLCFRNFWWWTPNRRWELHLKLLVVYLLFVRESVFVAGCGQSRI